MEDHMFLTYDTVSMGNWFLTFQGNMDVSSSMVDLNVLTRTEAEITPMSTWLQKPENLHVNTHNSMPVWRSVRNWK
jgi:hypothetical protein